VLVLQAERALDLSGNPLPLDRGERRFRTALRIEPGPIRRPLEPLLLISDVGVEAGEALVGVLPIDIAQRDDVFRREIHQVGAPLAADADGGNVQPVAGSREPRPSTCRGTIAKPADVAATWDTNLRLEILAIVMSPLTDKHPDDTPSSPTPRTGEAMRVHLWASR